MGGRLTEKTGREIRSKPEGKSMGEKEKSEREREKEVWLGLTEERLRLRESYFS